MDELQLIVIQTILVRALKRGCPRKSDKIRFEQWEKDARWVVQEMYSSGYLPSRAGSREKFLKELGLSE